MPPKRVAKLALLDTRAHPSWRTWAAQIHGLAQARYAGELLEFLQA
jgi:hypothetical protein